MPNLRSLRRGAGRPGGAAVRAATRALAWLLVLSVLLLGRLAAAGADPATPGATTPVVVVLDASGSMNTRDAPGPRIDAAKRAVRELIRALPAGAQVGLITYGTGTSSAPAAKTAGCHDIHVLAPVQRVNKPALLKVVAGVRARGYTPIGAALSTADQALPPGAGSIVLVSDGEDTCAPPGPCAVAAGLQTAHPDLVIHTIGFRVDPAARSQLRCIANAAGGSYRDAAKGADLGPVLRTQVDAGLRPYTVTGTPIDGTPTPSGAPRIAPGQYADAFARGGPITKYYSIQLAAPETLSIATTIVPPALRGGGTVQRLEVAIELLDGDGHRCLSTEREHDSVLAGKVDPVTAVLSAVVGGPSWSKRCGRDGPFVVKVTRDSASSTVTRSETIVRLEAPVVPVPSPVTTVPRGLTPPPAGPSRQACFGSASFDTAPALSDATCHDTLSSGETLYYRVHLGWGQRFSYQVVVARLAGANHGTGYVQSAVATPLRQQVTLASTSNSGRGFGGPVSISLTGSTLVAVDYGNRDSSRSDIRPYNTAGDYYISLGMSYPLHGLPYATGVRVSVDVAGAVRRGPHYLALPAQAGSAQDGPASGSSASGSRDSAAPPNASDGAAASSNRRWVVGGAALLVVVLGLVLGQVLRTRRRRTGAA